MLIPSQSYKPELSLRTTVLIPLALISILPASALTQTSAPPPSVRAIRAESAPRIDGVLDEPIWTSAQSVSDFVQRWPVEGNPVSERTEFMVAYDDDNLYVAARLYDEDPDGILASVLQREGPIGGRDDRIVIALDTYHDRRNAYIFELNPLGTQGDALITDERLVFSDWNWEGVYRSEGRITDEGWMLEVAIPFTTIRFAPGGSPDMGIAFYRHIQRKQEEALWPAIPLRYGSGIFQVSQYATLEGLDGITPGRNLQIKPFGILGGQTIRGEDDDLLEDAGLDIKWGITPSNTLDLTLNTDFAQVESDNVQINLTRFNLFFPEKREFFLERAGLFQFGSQREAESFFSRRIGLDSEILGGGRLVGQAGPLSYGVLSLQTEEGATTAGANNSVARLRADLVGRTTVGGIITNVQDGSDYARTAGVDASVRFWGNSSLSGWVSKNWDSATDLNGTAAGQAELGLRNDLFSFSAGYLDVGENFNPALGFVRRLDQRRVRADVRYMPRFPESPLLRQVTLRAGGAVVEGHDGIKQSHTVEASSWFRFQSGEFLRIDLNQDFERLDGSFFIRSDAEILPGDYTFERVGMRFSTPQRRAVSATVVASLGGFFGGNRKIYEASSLLRFSNHLALNIRATRNEISLPVANGDFSTNIVSANLEILGSRKLFANALIQYDTDSDEVQANLRVNWIHTPGSDLFVVFNSGYQLGDRLDPTLSRWVQRAGVVKLTYLWQF